ncbi:MAG: XRE family transcriptional regulator [Caldimonas sp.]
MKTIARSAAKESTDVLSKATSRAARQLGLSGSALSRVVGVSEATVSRMSRGEWSVSPQTKEGQLAALLVRLFRSLDAIVGNDSAKASAWMSSYNHALNGIPRELIESPQGLVMTLQYVDSMRATS